MKRSRFSEEQIIAILKEHETGVPVSALCGKHGVSEASIYKWNAKLKRMLADAMLDNVALKVVLCRRSIRHG